MFSTIDVDKGIFQIHSVPLKQCYFHVYNPYWRGKPQGYYHWWESNLLDRFIDTLRNKSYTRKQLGYIGLSNGYPRVIVSQCLDLLVLLEYIEIINGMYTYTLPKEINPEDVW